MNLTTLTAVKEFLNIKETSEDALIERLIQAASSFIEIYCNRIFASAVYTETFDGNNANYHVCLNSPVTAYLGEFDAGCVYGLFPKGRRNCTIIYTAGYLIVPPELEQACIYLVGIKYKSREHIDISTKSMGGENTTYISTEIPNAVKWTLARYSSVI